MTTMVMKIPPVLRRDFDLRLSVDNLIKVLSFAILYVILPHKTKPAFLLCFSTYYIRSYELDTVCDSIPVSIYTITRELTRI